MKFTDFDLGYNVLDGIRDMGFEDATPIQSQAIPIILSGKDLIGCAQTGTGKTGAFLIPTIDFLDTFEDKAIRCIVLCPTRELAKQIDEQVEGLSYHTVVTSIPVYGGGKGDDFSTQKSAILGGADIVVATPGRLIQHLTLGYMDTSKVEVVILDEADRMLDMGFHEDIMRILSYLPKQRQTLLFSATMPPKIRQLAREILHEPEEISLALSKPAAGINQMAYLAHDAQKLALLEKIFAEEPIDSMIIFASRKTSVDQIERNLKRLGYSVRGIHSDRQQEDRESILNDFRNKQFTTLIATDVMSRGIDIVGISHVLNYDVPADAEDYVHRIGRTARAEATGTAITLINEDDVHKFMRIEKLIEREVPKMPLPEKLGPGPEYKRGHSGGRGGRGGGNFGGKGRGNGPRGGGGYKGGNRNGGQGGNRNNGPSGEGGNFRRDGRPQGQSQGPRNPEGNAPSQGPREQSGDSPSFNKKKNRGGRYRGGNRPPNEGKPRGENPTPPAGE